MTHGVYYSWYFIRSPMPGGFPNTLPYYSSVEKFENYFEDLETTPALQ